MWPIKISVHQYQLKIPVYVQFRKNLVWVGPKSGPRAHHCTLNRGLTTFLFPIIKYFQCQKKKISSVLVQTLEPSVCPHPPDLPPFLPPCFFTACVDVDRTHSNVHLCCFHSGKNDKKSCVSLRHLTVSLHRSSSCLSLVFFFTPHPLCSCVRPSVLPSVC